MAEYSGIEWTTHSWNPWRGCVEVSPACDNCYAREGAKRNPRVLGVWGSGPDSTRPAAAEPYWRLPLTWNDNAGLRPIDPKKEPHDRVFFGSIMDVFEDRPELVPLRQRAFGVVRRCQCLRWLLLTKRPQNIRFMLPADWGSEWGILRFDRPLQDWKHVWLGTTVEDNARAAERIPHLIDAPARLRFLSCEPLLESLDLTPHLATGKIGWVIVGGESMQGGKCRPFNIEWAEEIVTQCGQHGVPVFVKQLGSMPLANGLGFRPAKTKKNDHGGDWNHWPDWLKKREIPLV